VFLTARRRDEVLGDVVMAGKLKFHVASAAQLREQVFKSAQWLTAQDITERVGFRTASPSLQLNKWTSAGLIFTISDEGHDKFPAYALGDDGSPLPIMKEILAAFAGKRQPLSIATWFAAANGWLGGKSPMEMLAEHGDAVVSAAIMEVAPIRHG